MDPRTFTINLRLRPDQVQLVLAKLSACPFGEVAEVITMIKTQGDAAIKLAQQQELQANAGAAKPPDEPVKTGMDVLTDKLN